MKRILVLSAAVAVAAMGVRAADEMRWKAAADGPFWGDASCWAKKSGNSYVAATDLPKTGDTIRFGQGLQGTDFTVTMTDDWALDCYRFDFLPPTDATMTFDGRGHTFCLPYSEAGAYYNEPFHFMTAGLTSNGSHVFSLEGYNMGADRTNASPIKIENPYLKLRYDSATKRNIYDLGGEFNVYDPEGTPVATIASRSFLIGRATGATSGIDMRFMPGSKLRCGKMSVAANGPDNRLVFDGAELETFVNPVLDDQASDCTNYICFVNGALWNNHATGDVSIRRTDNDTSGKFHPNQHRYLIVSNSTLNCANNLNFGMHGHGYFKDARILGGSKGGILYTRYDAEIVFDGGAITNHTLSIGDNGAGYVGKCTLNGTTVRGSGLTMGSNYVGEGELWMTNGATMLMDMNAAAGGATIGNTSTGRVYMADNARVEQPYQSFILGKGDATHLHAYGRMEMRSGANWALTGNDQYAYAGYRGRGELIIDGGSFKAVHFYIGDQANAAVTSSVSIAHGLLDATYFTMSSQAHRSRLTLGEGGVVKAKQIYGKTAGYASFESDGGTLRSTSVSSGTDFLSGLADARIGDGGLTVDTQELAPTMTQDFADKAGEQGVFRKTGRGMLTLKAGNYTVSKTVVEQGALAYATAAPTAFSTALEVRPGATFDLAAENAAVLVSDLVVSNATLRFARGAKLTVTGRVSVSGLVLDFADIPTDAQEVIVVDSELDAEQQANLARAMSGAVFPKGLHAKVTVTVGDGRTHVTAVAAEDEPIADAVTWRGASDDWNAAANWDPQTVPQIGRKAAFTEASALKTVTVPAGAAVSAIDFADDGYRLAGDEALTLAGEAGTVAIAVRAGSHEIGTPVTLGSQLSVDVASGASVALNGDITGGRIQKTGAGHLALGGENEFCGPVRHDSGTLTLADARAAGDITWYGDTLETRSENGEPFVLDGTITMIPSNETAAIVFKNENDVTVDLDLKTGAFVKRGAGRLTLPVVNGRQFAYGEGGWRNTSPGVWTAPNKLVFDADGTAPAGSVNGLYAGLSVVEGELYLKPAVEGERPTLTAEHSFLLGSRTASGTCAPTVTVDHVYLDIFKGSGVATWLGTYLTDGSGVAPFTRTCTFRAVNGAEVKSDTLKLGGWNVHPWLEVRGSKWLSTWSIVLADGTTGTGCAHIRGENAELYLSNGDGGALEINGNIDADFDNTRVYLSNEAKRMARFSTNGKAAGEMRFRNGSDIRIGSLAGFGGVTGDFTFAFDGATWHVNRNNADADFTFSNEWVSASTKVEMRGRGLVLEPGAGVTYTMALPLTGTGGFVNAGAGTVRFAPGACGFTGPLVAEAGTIDLTNAGVLEGAAIGGGAGRIVGGSLRGAKIALADFSGTNVPNLDGTGLAGRTTVVVAADVPDELPKGVVVATCTGAAPDVSGWKFRSPTHKGLGGVFTAKGGQIFMDVEYIGLLLIVR